MLRYFEAPPGLQFLHALENSCKGGESTFLDSFKVVEILKSQSPEDYKTLTETLVTFAYKNDGHHMHYKRPTIHTNGWNEDFSVYYAPPFQGTLDLDADQSASFYSAFKKFEKIIHQKSLIHTTFLAPGDCAIFANRRVLHGREAFEPTSGLRHFKGTYVDWDDFKDRLRIHNLYYTS